MAAIAGDFYFFAAGVLTEVATKFLVRRHVAVARFVGALVLFLVHVLLLTGMRRTQVPRRAAGARNLAKCWLGRSGGSAPNGFRRAD